jgi:hypothetical protein
LSNPTDIESCFFRFRCYNDSAEEYYHYSCGPGSAGLEVGQRFLSATDGILESAAAFTITHWDFDEASLPADRHDFTWLFLAETDMITGDWQPYGQAMADGVAGFDMLQPAVAPMQNLLRCARAQRNSRIHPTRHRLDRMEHLTNPGRTT